MKKKAIYHLNERIYGGLNYGLQNASLGEVFYDFIVLETLLVPFIEFGYKKIV